MKLIRLLLLFLAAAAACAAAQVGAAPEKARPHLVLFLADDFSWNDAGPYGSPDARTPNLDRLAQEGLRFDAAFAASPTCTPSRSCLYTGLYPFRNGAHTNHSLVRDEVRTLPQRLQALGYRVVLAGKTHIGPRPIFPFEYLEGSNQLPPGKKEVLWTDLNTQVVDRLLEQHDRAKQPLCLLVCSHSPHVYWPEVDGYDPTKLHLPPYLVDTPETRAARDRYLTDVTWMDRQVGEVRNSLRRHGYAENTLFLFSADQGAQWPFAKWNLYDAGLRVPLLAHWPGHVKVGTTKAMVSLIDVLPTFLAAAGAPAATDLDGHSFLPVLEGKSHHLRDEVFAAHTGDKEMNRAPSRCIRTSHWKLIANLAPEITYRTHISGGNGLDGRVYWDSWLRFAPSNPAAARLIERYEHRPAVELYDLERDPWELENLAANPKHARTVAELQEKLKQWRLQQGEDLTKIPMPEDARLGEIPYAR